MIGIVITAAAPTIDTERFTCADCGDTGTYDELGRQGLDCGDETVLCSACRSRHVLACDTCWRTCGDSSYDDDCWHD